MIVFISDLHLGDGSKSDDFHRDAEFIEFLKWTDGRAKEIVILGDLYELWQAKYEKVIWHHAAVIRALEARRDKITYVFGNHDYLPFARVTAETYRSGDGRIVAQHGHQYDKYNEFKNPLRSIKWPIGRWITLAVAGLERIIHPDVDWWLEKQRNRFGSFMIEVSKLHNRRSRNKAWRGELEIQTIKGLRDQHIGQISIFGHSHNAEVLKIPCDTSPNFPSEEGAGWGVKGGHRIYANCGSWTDAEYPTFIAVTKSGVQVRDGYEPDEVLEEVKI